MLLLTLIFALQNYGESSQKVAIPNILMVMSDAFVSMIHWCYVWR